MPYATVTAKRQACISFLSVHSAQTVGSLSLSVGPATTTTFRHGHWSPKCFWQSHFQRNYNNSLLNYLDNHKQSHFRQCTFLFKYVQRRLQESAWFGLYQSQVKCKNRFNFVERKYPLNVISFSFYFWKPCNLYRYIHNQKFKRPPLLIPWKKKFRA